MSQYIIKRDRCTPVAVEDSLDAAVARADALLEQQPADLYATFTIEDADGKFVGLSTKNRIVGTFLKQQWGGRKGDDAIPIDEEEFDATDAILLMNHAELVGIQDGSESSDEIGQRHVSWDGPCEVQIVDSIRDFFGVDSLEDITEEALMFARQRLNPQPHTTEVITLNVKVHLHVAPGASVSDFVENLDYAITSKTVGITIRDTEIVSTN